jgi:hypothetical protein
MALYHKRITKAPNPALWQACGDNDKNFCASIINVSFKDVVIPLRRRMAATTESSLIRNPG